MGDSYVKTWLVALLVALMPCIAGAAGLGRITVLTAIGQPLIAEIDLSVTREELGSLSARLALPDAYRLANLQYNTALTGARLTIEKRPNGQTYLKVVTTRPVVEPFIDLLVELKWSSGQMSREYTALLDPPGIPPAVAPPAPVISALPESAPAPQLPPAPAPEPPVAVAAPPAPAIATLPESAPAPGPQLAPAPAPTEPVSAESQPTGSAEPQPTGSAEPQPTGSAEPQPTVSAEPPPGVAAAPSISTPITPAPLAGTREYGPIERGETLGKIARSVMPDGVTLEQMLVALYRTNPEAFIRKNLNLVRTGRILRVPERDEVTAMAPDEAVREYRTHVADWNAYRQQVAEAAGTVPAEGRTAVSGKIAAKVEDKAAGAPPKDVVRLSKGEPPATAGKGKPRATADRSRVLEEELVARQKALAEANDRIAQLEKTVKDMQKLVELKSPAMAAAQQQAQQVTAPKPAPQPAPAAPEAKKPPVTAAAPTPKPAPKAKAKAAPSPPTPEPDLVDEIVEAITDPLYLGAGGGVIVLGGLAFWMARRRRARTGEGESPPIAPRLSTAAAAAAEAAAMTGDTTAAPTARAAEAASGEDVDPMAEADVYIQYGRDEQAEEILKEAMARSPRRADVQLKLLEIYAARKDEAAFAKLAGDFHRLTGGTGEGWLKAAAMGYALDPANRLYEAGKDAAAPVVRPAGTASDIDLDLGGAGPSAGISTTDIDLGAAPSAEVGTTSDILDLGAPGTAPTEGGEKETPLPDFTLDLPQSTAATQTVVALDSADLAKDSNMIDFQIELPKVDSGVATVAKPVGTDDDTGLDFKLELPDLDLGAKPKAAGGEKDGHWHDVQTKFDLAKAYQEMGDKDGAKEILQEVIKEGDAEQQAQARTLMTSLG